MFNLVRVGLPLLALAAVSATPPAPAEDAVAELVRQLGDDDYTTRHRAERELWKLGRAAEAAVNAAAESGPPEVRLRAGRVADKFRRGNYPGTPPDICDAIDCFQSGDFELRKQALASLLGGDAARFRAAVDLVRDVDRGDCRQLLWEITSKRLPSLTTRVGRGEADEVWRLLQVAADKRAWWAAAHYAVVAARRGATDAALAHVRGLPPDKDDSFSPLALVYLHRLRGDGPAALAAAERVSDARWVGWVAYEHGAWEVALSRARQPSEGSGAGQLVELANLQRLAGRREALARTVQQLENLPSGASPHAGLHKAAALALCARPAGSVVSAFSPDDQAEELADVLVSLLRLREASELAARPVDSPSPAVHFRRQSLRVRVSTELGPPAETRRQLAALRRLADSATADADNRFAELALAAATAGEADLARDAFLKAVSLNEGRQLFRLHRLFPRLADAPVLWRLLRRLHPADRSRDTFERLRRLEGGDHPAGVLGDLVRDTPAAVRGDPHEQNFQLAVCGLVAERGRLDLVRHALASPAWETLGHDALVKLGDALAARGRPGEAAGVYRRAWGANPNSSLALWLYADELGKRGDAECGVLKRRAHEMGLGNQWHRDRLARGLAERGFADAARSERDIVLALEPGTDEYYGAAREAAAESERRGDFERAASAYEKNLFNHEAAHFGQNDTVGFMATTARIFSLRAAAHADAGRKPDALREAEAAERVLPTAEPLATLVVPALQRAGWAAEADALFGRVAGRYEAAARDCPDSPNVRSRLVRLLAGSGRPLKTSHRTGTLTPARLSPGRRPPVAGNSSAILPGGGPGRRFDGGGVLGDDHAGAGVQARLVRPGGQALTQGDGDQLGEQRPGRSGGAAPRR